MNPEQIEKLVAVLSAEIDRRIASTPGGAAPVALADAVVESIKTYIVKCVGPVVQRVQALEARRSMSYEGSFDPGRPYREGDCVQRSGGLYVCLADTHDTPGDTSSWRRIGHAK